MDYEEKNMRCYIIESVEMRDEAVYLHDGVNSPIKIVEGIDGQDFLIKIDGSIRMIVDSKMLIGALKAISAKGDRERSYSKGRT